MAQGPQGPILTTEGEEAANRRLRRAILLIVVLFAGYGIFATVSEGKPGWVKLGPEAYPAALKQAVFADGVLAAGKAYVFRIKRTGRERSKPPRRLRISIGGAAGTGGTGETRATYRCQKRTRCPWVRLAPLRCQLDDAASGPCGLELFEFGRTGIEILPRRRCVLTRPGIRDLKVVCPTTLKLGERIAK